MKEAKEVKEVKEGKEGKEGKEDKRYEGTGVNGRHEGKVSWRTWGLKLEVEFQRRLVV